MRGASKQRYKLQEKIGDMKTIKYEGMLSEKAILETDVQWETLCLRSILGNNIRRVKEIKGRLKTVNEIIENKEKKRSEEEKESEKLKEELEELQR